MKHPRRAAKVLSFMVIALLLFVNTASAALAMGRGGRPEPPAEISSLTELLAWYNAPGGEMSMLTGEIVVDRTVRLAPAGRRAIQAVNYAIRVAAGGTLVLDSPDIEIFGIRNIITVESDGTLLLNKGRYDVADSEPLITVRQGGRITVGADAHLGADGKDDPIVDENIPDPPVNPDPPPVNPNPPIVNIFDERFHLTCLAGEPPAASQYPQTAGVAVSMAYPNVSLPVVWDIQAVDFNKPGTVAIVGRFTEETLTANGLSNPQGFTVPMTITICVRGAVETARGNFLRYFDGKKSIKSQMVLPALPGDVKALYLFQSRDGVLWEKLYKEEPDGSGGMTRYEDFLPGAVTIGPSSYVTCKYANDIRWVRVQIVGSIYDGMTNNVKIEPVAGSTGGNGNHNENDGSSGGNRGGGTQEEEERDPAQKAPAPDAFGTNGFPPLPDMPIPPPTGVAGVPPAADASEFAVGFRAEGNSRGSNPTAGESEPDPPAESPPEDNAAGGDSESPESEAGESIAPVNAPPPERAEELPATGAAAAFLGGAGVCALAGYLILRRRGE